MIDKIKDDGICYLDLSMQTNLIMTSWWELIILFLRQLSQDQINVPQNMCVLENKCYRYNKIY